MGISTEEIQVSTGLTKKNFFVSTFTEKNHGAALWIVWTNRLLAIFIIWVVAVFLIAQV
jgi:hypothetical protein